MDAATTLIKPGKIQPLAVLASGLLSLLHFSASAKDKAMEADTSTVFSNPTFLMMLCVVILMLIVIIVLAKVVKAAAYHKGEMEKAKRQSSGMVIKTALILITLGGFSNSIFAQTEAGSTLTAASSTIWGLESFTFYLMISIIAFETFIAWMLYNISMDLLGVTERKRLAAEEKANQAEKEITFIEKLNASVPIEEEAEIMLNHNYDGIRELDNNLPPWWKYGFYFTIVFAVIYMIHYHILGTGKLQTAEYQEQLAQAKQEMEEYRKRAANLVDENSATFLSDEISLSSGKSIYMDNCAACHGRAGEGGVGPNLTDEYWLHSGGIKDIFKTIKYGYPEKGMKAWQQDLGAKQIHEVASFIKSLKGTNPANAKEKQGDLYKEEGAVSDSTTTADSTKIIVTEK